jgi:GWxTD domain-containing protein
MDEKKYKQMLKISEPDSLKVAVDHFWLSNIEDEQEALEVLQLYYERVEEANKQFSNFKEGWKTDPGMVYILFGPPWYNLTRGNTMIWYYSFNRQDPNYYYEFVKPVTKHDSYPFDHWILERKPGYFDIHQQQLNLWLSGIILNRPIY